MNANDPRLLPPRAGISARKSSSTGRGFSCAPIDQSLKTREAHIRGFSQLSRLQGKRSSAKGAEGYEGEEEEYIGERTRGRDGEDRAEKRGRAGLPPLPHKYGFSRAVYERKRVEPRERSRA